MVKFNDIEDKLHEVLDKNTATNLTKWLKNKLKGGIILFPNENNLSFEVDVRCRIDNLISEEDFDKRFNSIPELCVEHFIETEGINILDCNGYTVLKAKVIKD
ncbi:MAG: hypothetical protein WC346_16290 [Methanogenium sp.]|jgi:hypothetical protein